MVIGGAVLCQQWMMAFVWARSRDFSRRQWRRWR
jgi:hypothetical protein